MTTKLRRGSYLPSILEHCHRVDQAFNGVVMEAYVGGISTRKVDALLAAPSVLMRGVTSFLKPGLRLARHHNLAALITPFLVPDRSPSRRSGSHRGCTRSLGEWN